MDTIQELDKLYEDGKLAGNWRSAAQWRQKNRSWLRISGYIALIMLEAFEHTGADYDRFCSRTGFDNETLSKMLKGSYNFTLMEIKQIEDFFGIEILARIFALGEYDDDDDE